VTAGELADPSYVVEPQFWVSRHDFDQRIGRRIIGTRSAMLGFRRVTRSTDERTTIACLLPWGPASYGWILVTGPDLHDLLVLLALFNSFVFDYVMRGALSQPSVPQSTAAQLPMPTREHLRTIGMYDDLADAALALSWTARDLDGIGDEVAPTQRESWEPERRGDLRTMIDAWSLRAYGVTRAEAEHILDSFLVLRRREMSEAGAIVTRHRVLAAYDALVAAGAAVPHAAARRA
jgi:hypothetical protein